MNEIERWNDYVSRFDTNDPKIQLKIKHTMKVCAIMDGLSDSLELDAHDHRITHTIALYHDIGRFEQLKQFGTFLDHQSVDHAALGVLILKENPFLEEYSMEEKEQILFAIANHNKYRIEKTDDQKKLLFAKMIRDADKCDIFRVFACEDLQTATSTTLEQIKEDIVSPEIEQMIMDHCCVEKEKRKTGLDVWVTFLGFFFDFNFRRSFSIAKEQGYYRQPFEKIRFTKAQAQIDRILNEVESYIEKNI